MATMAIKMETQWSKANQSMAILNHILLTNFSQTDLVVFRETCLHAKNTLPTNCTTGQAIVGELCNFAFSMPVEPTSYDICFLCMFIEILEKGMFFLMKALATWALTAASLKRGTISN